MIHVTIPKMFSKAFLQRHALHPRLAQIDVPSNFNGTKASLAALVNEYVPVGCKRVLYDNETKVFADALAGNTAAIATMCQQLGWLREFLEPDCQLAFYQPREHWSKQPMVDRLIRIKPMIDFSDFLAVSFFHGYGGITPAADEVNGTRMNMEALKAATTKPIFAIVKKRMANSKNPLIHDRLTPPAVVEACIKTLAQYGCDAIQVWSADAKYPNWPQIVEETKQGLPWDLSDELFFQQVKQHWFGAGWHVNYGGSN